MDTRKPKLDDMIDAMQADMPDAAEFAAAAARVRQQLAESAAPPAASAADACIRDCAGFRNLIPAYRDGSLPAARRTLFEDHIRNCVACRKAVWQTTESSATPAVRRPVAFSPRWALAAAAVLLLALAIPLVLYLNPFASRAEATAVVDRVDGRLFVVQDGRIQPVAAGVTIPAGQTIRTARGTRAILSLADGSRLEMNERAELAVNGRADGTAVGLRHGSVIVRAARQTAGHHLFVDTTDCQVSVKGTVFSVTSGAKGSRVSVLEGEVWVDHGGQTSKLFPGHQVTTHASIRPAALAREVGWSLEADQYQALLRQVADTSRQLLQSVTNVPLRFDPRLAALLPEDTVIVAALPNVSEELADAGDTFFQSIRSNPELAAALARELSDTELNEVVGVLQRFRALGAHLGDEVVVGAWDLEDEHPGIVLLAEVKDAASLRGMLADEISRLNSQTGREVPVILVDDPALLPATGVEALYVLVTADHLFVSSAPEALRQCTAAAAAGTGSFLQSAFGAQIAQSYADGAAWLFAADLAGLRLEDATVDPATHELLGFQDVRYLVVEQKTVADQPQLRLAVSFAGERRGIPSWLGEPGAMGTLDFVSPDAYAAACVLAKEPRAIVDELFDILATVQPEDLEEFLKFEDETGLSLRDDLAAPLGGEFLLAVDGPVLPNPAWKLVLLVDDPARFQGSLERLIEAINGKLAAEGKATLSIRRDELSGDTYYTVASADSAVTVHYSFHDGYLIMAPERALITQAIANRINGYTLPQSADFQAALPTDRYTQFSAVVYHNAQKLAGSLAGIVPERTGDMSADELQQVRDFLLQLKPMLFCAYGEPDRIVLTGTGLMSLNPADWAKFASPDRLMKARPQSGKVPADPRPRPKRLTL